MASYGYAVYVDEAGLDRATQTLDHLWICAGISFAYSDMAVAEAGVKAILGRHFRLGTNELKGHYISRQLKLGATGTVVTQMVAELLERLDARVWVAGTRHGINPLPNFAPRSAREIARQLFLERLNGALGSGAGGESDYQLVWDVSSENELRVFSRHVTTFKNAYSGEPRNPRLAHALLGGCSHDWPGLQLADYVAHYAAHERGHHLKLTNANPQKAVDFDAHLRPLLAKSANGSVVGWVWW